MKIARLAVLGVALVAGIGAAIMASGSKPEGPTTIVRAPPPVETDDVLVAGKELPLGTVVADGDIRWESWPKKNIPAGLIQRSQAPNGIADIKGSVVRAGFLPGEPLRRERLVKGANSGFLSAVLPAGSRAVAITIDAQGSTSAGGFILPNDRVDIIRTYRDENAAKSGQGDVLVSETLLTNIRVLAIGQNIQERNNQPVVVGSNATLELTPRQAETIVLAQRVGQLSLTLRSMADSQQTSSEDAPPPAQPQAMTIVRYGVATQAAAR